MALVTLATAKTHLRITTPTTSPLSAEDADLSLKIEAASDIILGYLKVSSSLYDEWTVPARMQAATLLMLGRLHMQRGDDEAADAACWQAIERLLVRDRDPALA